MSNTSVVQTTLDAVLQYLNLIDEEERQITGRKLDALLLKEVVIPLVSQKIDGRDRSWPNAPFYSTSLDDALEIVELMLEKQKLAVSFYQNVRKLLDANKDDCALVRLFLHDRPAEAICVAALLTMRGINV